MKIELNRKAKIPLSKQIYQEISDRILSGYFPSGSRLPSVRKLAKELSVSPVTVMEAFELLTKDQLISRIQGKGTFVNDLTRSVHTNKEHTQMNEFPDYLHRSQSLHFSEHPAPNPFSLSIVDPQLLPSSILAKSVQKAIAADPEILVQYGEIQGDSTLRKAFAHYLHRENIAVDSSDILVTNGSHQGIDLVARCFLGPSDIVITEEATYPGAIDIFRSRGAVVVSVPMDEEGMSIKHLIQTLDYYSPKLIYTMPTFQNPTGRVMSIRRRKQLLELAEEMNFLILEDDPWSEIYFDELPPPHIKSFDKKGYVIYLKGLSKMLAPGCRVGFLTAEKSILRRLIATKTNADMGNPLLNQRIILPIFQKDLIDSILEQLRSDLRMRRDLTLQLLKQHAPSAVQWMVPKGGFNFWISLPEEINTIDLLFHTKQQGVDFFPGSACYPIDVQTHHFRLSFSNSSLEQIQQGIPILCQTIDDYIVQHRPKQEQKPKF